MYQPSGGRRGSAAMAGPRRVSQAASAPAARRVSLAPMPRRLTIRQAGVQRAPARQPQPVTRPTTPTSALYVPNPSHYAGHALTPGWGYGTRRASTSVSSSLTRPTAASLARAAEVAARRAAAEATARASLAPFSLSTRITTTRAAVAPRPHVPAPVQATAGRKRPSAHVDDAHAMDLVRLPRSLRAAHARERTHVIIHRRRATLWRARRTAGRSWHR
jgi:hypothetical protein